MRTLYTVFASAIITIASAKTLNTKPNILLILADDMGYSDLGCYGGEIETPNIDNLAEQGVRFTQFYNTARCCPSRASLMTGLYPHETGIGHMTHKVFQGPVYQGYLNDKCVTIPEILGNNGYSTYMVGKWHMGTEEVAWPGNRGFNHYFGIHNWVDSYYRVLPDCEIYEDGKLVMKPTGKKDVQQPNGKEWYTTEVFTNKALEYLQSCKTEQNPFFLYMAYNAPHWPLEAPDSLIEKYLPRYKNGWTSLMNEKLKRLKKMKILEVSSELANQNIPEWEPLPDSIREDLVFKRAMYAAQVDALDYNVGRLINFLKENEMFDNTIVIFLSDNGCSAEPIDVDFGFNFCVNTKWNYSDWKYNSGRAGISQGRVWSIVSNAPFRLYKRFIHEGGISTPFIISYPNKIKKGGTLVNVPAYLPDVLPTLMEYTGNIYPEKFKGIEIESPKGVSLVSAIRNKKFIRHIPFFWEHEGSGGVRLENWKLVTTNIKTKKWELYNLDNDRAENHDLADLFPEKEKELKSLWEEWAEKIKVLPQVRIKN